MEWLAILARQGLRTHAFVDPPENISRKTMKEHAVYPGSFDPLTLGHLDLIERSTRIFSHLTVAVATLSNKSSAMFEIDERIAMTRDAVKHLPNVSIAPLDGLLV